jgi:hypothetical protein
MLLKEVRRNQRQFWATIFWRDFREVAVAAWLTWLFSHWAIRRHQWPLFIMAGICFAVGAFMVVDRLLQRKKQTPSSGSLKNCIESSLRQVNHQIWLLKNVLWWYLLPLGVGIAGLSGYTAWDLIVRHSAPIHLVAAPVIGNVVIGGLLYWGIYWLNQYAVRKTLEPRQKELQLLLTTLNENTP